MSPPAPPATRARRVRQLARQHWALLLLLLAGGVLRLLVMIGYAPAFWYHGDSGQYVASALRHEAGVTRPYGYSLFLSFLLGRHSTWLIVGLQHLMGLALAIGGYVFLHRRGVSRLVGTLAVVPLLLDARTVALEHFLLAETLFTVLVVIGMAALCWRPTPGWLGTLIAAGAFSYAALTRSIGLVALAVPLLYLLLRRVSWRRTLAFVAVVGVALGGYLFWYHSQHGEYAFGGYAGRFLWSRTTSFVDCQKLDLTGDERRLCPAEPIEARLPPDVYLWTRAPYPIPGDERHVQAYDSFARKAIRAQPGDYALTVGTDLWRIFVPGPYPTERIACLGALWTFTAHGEQGCQAFFAPADPMKARYTVLVGERDHPLMEPLHAYAGIATVPATLIALCFLLTTGLACYRPRSSSWRDHLDPLAWAGLAFGMIVGSIATSAIDPRYAVPSLPLAVVGAALAWRRFQAARQPNDAPDGSTREPSAVPDASDDRLAVAADLRGVPAPDLRVPRPEGGGTDPGNDARPRITEIRTGH